MERVSLQQLLLVMSLLCCRPAFAPPAAPRVRPSSCQFFSFTAVFLSCEENSSAGWTLRRNTSRDTRAECEVNWGRSDGSTCFIIHINEGDSGVYWCESSSGSRSSSINITVSSGSVILQSPVLPVTEGQNITIYCRTKESSILTADFYKDGSLISTESTGHMTIHHVTKSDEGAYKCSIKASGESPSSWIQVLGKPVPSTSLHLLLHLLVLCPYLISTLIMAPLYQHKPSGSDLLVSMTASTQDLDKIEEETTEQHF